MLFIICRYVTVKYPCRIMEALVYTCGYLYCLIISNFLHTSFATAPTSQELDDNSLCVHMIDTTSYEWGTLQNSFEQGVSLAATFECWDDSLKCHIANINDTIFFSNTEVEILSNQAIPGVITVVTFALKIPSFFTPVSPPSLVPLNYLVNMSSSLSSQIQGATGKSVSVCIVTTSNNVMTTSSAASVISTTSSSAIAISTTSSAIAISTTTSSAMITSVTSSAVPIVISATLSSAVVPLTSSSSSNNANSVVMSSSPTPITTDDTDDFISDTNDYDDESDFMVDDMSTDLMYMHASSNQIPTIITTTTTVYMYYSSSSTATQMSSTATRMSTTTRTSSQVQTPTENPVIVIVSEEAIRANIVLVTIGITSVEQWNNDLNLRLAFTLAIATKATLYCAENLQECLLQQSTTFSSSDVQLQEGYPVAVSSSSIKVSVGLYIPPSAMLISEANDHIIPRATLIAIILKAATPFYLQTGRPILEIEAPTNEDTSGNTGLVAGTTIPLLLLTLAGVGIVVLFVVIHTRRRKKDQFKNAQLPGEDPVGAVDLLSYRIVGEEQ